jgi:hypothetical protein
MKIYGVIIMDIVGSKKIVARNQFQKRLNSYIAQMNQKHRNILVAPITITLGDEWQVITRKPSECYNLVHEFQQMLWKDEVELYAGIGLGPLATSEDRDLRKMDGPCFHYARAAVNIAKTGNKAKNRDIFSKRNRVYVEAPDTSILKQAWDEVAATSGNGVLVSLAPVTIVALMNIIIENNEILKAKMTPKQRQVYVDYLKHGSYREILRARDDGTIGAISQKLNNAEFFTIQRNYEMVKALLDYCCASGRTHS